MQSLVSNMNILLLSHKFSPDIGGIESISEMLADSFSQTQHNIRVLTWSPGGKSDNFSYPVVRKPTITQLIKQLKWADVVFENNPCLRLSWPSIFMKKKSVVGLQTWVYKSNKKSLQGQLKMAWLKKAQSVIACSQAIRKGCWPNAIVIGNPYLHSRFKCLSEIQRTGNFVFVGRLVSDKGADLAIEAFEQVVMHGNNSNIQLTMIGDGPERSALEKMVSDKQLTDKVTFLGARNGQDLVNQLNMHRFMLVPSKWEEPFGIVALEGMACGCIPIVANHGGLPDAIGNAGLTAKPNNVDDWYITIKSLLKDRSLQEQLTNNASRHLEKFTSHHVASKYLEVIENA